MPDPTAPTQLPGSRNDYAPIAPAAVAAAISASVFVALLVVLALFAVTTGKSLLEPWILIFPVLTVVLAFVARRQIRASEGARTGENWANASWTVAVIGGAVLLAYLFAVQYAIRREATSMFTSFADAMAKADANDPRDPNLIAAAFYTLPPGQQSVVKSPTNVAAMTTTHKVAVTRLMVSDLGRLVARNKGAVSITPGTLVKWEQKGSGIESVMAGTAETPEGAVTINVPLLAESLDGQPRRWHIQSPPDGDYFSAAPRRLTPYGWAIELLGESAGNSLRGILAFLAQPGLTEVIYEGYVRPDGDLQEVVKSHNARTASALPRAALLGTTSLFVKPPAGMAEAVDRLFANPAGEISTGPELERFRALFLTPARFLPSTTRIKENTDTHPLVTLGGGRVEAVLPIEVVLSAEGQNPPTARGRVVLRLSDSVGAALSAKLEALKSSGGERTTTPPPELLEEVRSLNWKLTRIESDLHSVRVAEPSAPGAPGSPPGMMR